MIKIIRQSGGLFKKLFFPSRSKSDHPSKKFRFPLVHAGLDHIFIADFLEFLQVVAGITQLPIFETKAAIFIRFSNACIF
jgi:hypothetical protein